MIIIIGNKNVHRIVLVRRVTIYHLMKEALINVLSAAGKFRCSLRQIGNHEGAWPNPTASFAIKRRSEKGV